MTWLEFKKSVESQGVKDDDQISWIDIHGDLKPLVGRYKSGEVKIQDGEFRDASD